MTSLMAKSRKKTGSSLLLWWQCLFLSLRRSFFNLQVENPSNPILHGCTSFLELHLDANASCFISGKMISKMAYNNKWRCIRQCLVIRSKLMHEYITKMATLDIFFLLPLNNTCSQYYCPACSLLYLVWQLVVSQLSFV